MKKNYLQNKRDIYNENYHLGLDIGTNSIGWAVHQNNNIISYGVYLDSKVEDAKDRRDKRSGRRNQRRRTYRLKLFEKLAIERDLISESFGSESKYNMYSESARLKRLNNEYYHTMYHLKVAAIDKQISKSDLFLVLYHSLKNRGHFLLNFDYDKINSLLENEKSFEFERWLEEDIEDVAGFENFLLEVRKKNYSKKDLEKEIKNKLKEFEGMDKNTSDNLRNEILFIFGFAAKLSHLDETNSDLKSARVDRIEEYVTVPQKVYLLSEVAAILGIKYIIGNYRTLSDYIVNERYEYFADENNRKEFVKVNEEVFKKGSNKYLRNFVNREYSNQLYVHEATKVLQAQQQYYPNILTDDFINSYLKLLKAKIPYFVGPLAKSSEFSWVNSSGGITPWNLTEKVDYGQASKDFIDRMVLRDLYTGEPVLADNTYLYQYYKVLADMNNFRISDSEQTDRKLTKEEKQKLIEGLYYKEESITKTKIVKALEAVCNLNDVELYSDQVDDNTKYASLKTYCQLNNSLQLGLSNDQLDDVAQLLTYYEDYDLRKKELLKYFKSQGVNMSEEKFKRLLLLKYSGYGRYSKKLLTQEVVVAGMSIIEAMDELGLTFNELINDSENPIFSKENQYAAQKIKLNYDLVADMYAPTKVKAMLNNLFVLLNDIHKHFGYPKTVTIEMAREEGVKKQTKSKTEKLKVELATLKKNKNFKNQEWLVEMEEYLKDGFKVDYKLQLYVAQEGKDLYDFDENGNPRIIDIEKIKDYDIDHIVPYTFNYDDSMNNKVLTKKSANSKKGNAVPLDFLEGEEKEKFIKYVEYLRKVKLISAKKKENLLSTSKNKYTSQGFQNSQLNDTRYITKEIVAILKSYYKQEEVETKINTINANVVKKVTGKARLVKIREISDKHHAIDAYLASIVYLAINERFPWIDSVKSSFLKENGFNDGGRKFDKASLLSVSRYLDDIYEIIDGDNLLQRIDEKDYQAVRKVRKKVTGKFFAENYVSEKDETDVNKKKEAVVFLDKLMYRQEADDWRLKEKHKLKNQNVESARVDIFYKNNKSYIFAVPKFYFSQKDNVVTLDKKKYQHGLDVINTEIWKPKEKVTIDDYKFSLWKGDKFYVEGEKYFVVGGVNKNKTLEFSIVNERSFSLQQVRDFIFIKDFNDKGSYYRYKKKAEFLYYLLKDNKFEDIKLYKKFNDYNVPTISVKHMLLWYSDKNQWSEEEKQLFTEIYDTQEKQEMAMKYFNLLVTNKNFSKEENKKVKENFYKLMEEISPEIKALGSGSNEYKTFKKEKKDLKGLIDFSPVAYQNIFSWLTLYNKNVENSKNKKRYILSIASKKDYYKIVESPTGLQHRKIKQEKFVTEFKIK